MTFLTPITALIAAALTVPLLVGLYFLKLRRQPKLVPSTLLWRKAVQDLQVNAPFQRLRNSLLLWLQLLLLALLLLAFARPADEAAAVRGDRVAILVDRSASMSATDGDNDEATRLDAAKQRARSVIDALDGEAAAMVVSFADRPRVVQAFTTDRAALRRAVETIGPSDAPGDLDAALAVLGPMLEEAGSGDDASTGSVVILSDGRFPDRGGRPGVALRGVEVTYLPVGEASTSNVGFVAADARRKADDPAAIEIFGRLVHAGDEPRDVGVELWIDEQLHLTRRLRIAGRNDRNDSDRPGEAIVRFAARVSGTAAIELRHDADDALPADDTARLTLSPSRARRVLVVTPGGNPFLGEAFRAAGVDRLDTIPPASFASRGTDATAGYDLIVFDRFTPEAPVTAVSTLSFAATPGIDGFGFVPPPDDQANTLGRALTWQTETPVMRFVALDDVPIRGAGRLVLPPGGRALAMGMGGPLIGRIDLPETGTSHVAVAFDVRASRWPLSWSFQVFVVNALDALAGDTAGAATWHAAGRPIPVRLADPNTDAVSFTGPAGSLQATVRAGRATLPGAERVGWYDASNATGPAVDPADARLAVNLLDPTESDLAVVEVLPVSGAIAATSTGQGVAAAEQVRREWWPWVLGAALALLCVEWWVYVGRVRV